MNADLLHDPAPEKKFLRFGKDSLFFLLIGWMILSSCSTKPSPDFPQRTGVWDSDSLGNHRIVLHVDAFSTAVRVPIPWRRRDNPVDKGIIVIDESTGERILNVAQVGCSQARTDLIFEPKSVPGYVYVYTHPFRKSGSQYYPRVEYPIWEDKADPQWRQSNAPADLSPDSLDRFPSARLLAFESRDLWNAFTQMEESATPEEMKELLTHHPEPFLLFAEDRTFPIRMTKSLPRRWILKGPGQPFAGECSRGEYYPLQIGVYAAAAGMKDLEVEFTDLEHNRGKGKIPSDSLTCFNTQGVDWMGKPMKRVCSVPPGEVQPLWIGVAVSEETEPGLYSGRILVRVPGFDPQEISVALTVKRSSKKDRGDSEPEGLGRLRWLNSKTALNDSLVKPYTPLRVSADTVFCLGRAVLLGPDGLPKEILSYFAPEMTHLDDSPRSLLAHPMRFAIETRDGKLLNPAVAPYRVTGSGKGSVSWEGSQSTDDVQILTHGRFEFDGCLEYKIDVVPLSRKSIGDIRLVIPVRQDAAKYMMGLGVKGGRCPAQLTWKWDDQKNQDGLWIGDVNAGMQVSFQDRNYVRPLNTNFYHLKPLNMPLSWHNNGLGSIMLHQSSTGSMVITASSGSRTLIPGDSLHFHFRLLLTPFRPLDTNAQWKTRYYHAYKPLEEIEESGANTINVHHATEINPYINYPFLRPEAMKLYVDEAHRKKMKVKIYYTVRELSNRAHELFALKSLGNEILADGPGGGPPWLQEHLDGNYIPGWYVPAIQDAAIINSGISRWHNYYIEGLQWLVKHIGIDGLYIDDVAFDRTTMKRVRRVLDQRPGSLIDLHSANQYNHRDGFASSANLYLEHFPYIDRLWFGEYFDYDSPPEYWLVEMSGIPFGLMGEMLQDGGNPWRGMVFGMTSRLPWSGNPGPLWDLWDDFGIEDSRMVGYWVESNPVWTDRKEVPATAYLKEDRALIAIASWAEYPIECRIHVDFNRLDYNPRYRLRAPEIPDFQPARIFEPDQAIPIDPGKGWLLILEPRNGR